MAKTKQKKKARKPRKTTRLPKPLEALLNYLGPPTMGAPTIQQTGQRFASTIGGSDDTSKGFATQVAEAVIARQAAMKAAKIATGAEPLKKSLVSTIIQPQQQQPQTIVLQQPSAQPSQTQTEDIRKEVMKETGGIERRLTKQLREQGLSQLFATVQESKAQKYDIGSLPSQMVSSFGRQSAPSFAQEGFTSGEQGELESVTSLEPSSASASNFPVVSQQEAAAYQAQQYSKSLASAQLPPAQKLRGKAPKEPKSRTKKATFASQSPAQITIPSYFKATGGLAAIAQAQTPRSVSSAASAGTSASSKSRAREIYETATQQGLSGGDIVFAMAQGGGAAAREEPQQVGMSAMELASRGKKKTKLRIVKKLGGAVEV